jgi:hypothetical protein
MKRGSNASSGEEHIKEDPCMSVNRGVVIASSSEELKQESDLKYYAVSSMHNSKQKKIKKQLLPWDKHKD